MRSDKNGLIEMFQEIAHFEREIEKMKVDLAVREDFNLIDAFGMLDIHGKGYIIPTEMRE